MTRPAIRVWLLALLAGLIIGSPSCVRFDLLDPSRRPGADEPTGIPAARSWERAFGGGGDDGGRSVQVAAGGGYAVAGYREKEPAGSGDLDLWLLRTDAEGNELWSLTFGGSGRDVGTCLRRTLDGGYILAGYTDSIGAGALDAWLIKTDAAGDEQWSRTYGGAADDRVRAVEQTADGGYILAIDSESVGSTPLWLLKVDAAGEEAWSSFPATAFSGWHFCAMEATDGDFVVAGVTGTAVTVEDAYLARTDALGTPRWSISCGREFPDRASCLDHAQDGGIVVAGHTRSWGSGDFDAWLIRFDGTGAMLWSRTFGGAAWDSAECVRQTVDGGFILAGTTHFRGRDAWLLKTDGQGVEQWQAAFGGSGDDGGYWVEETPEGGYIATGQTSPAVPGGGDLYLLYYRP